MIKLKGLAAEDLNGFMDEGTEFLGELRFRDTFRIDGRLKGKIVSDNTLIIGEPGRWTPRSTAGWSPSGARSAAGSTAASASSSWPARKVQATLISPRLVIEEGAFFQGECDMGAAAAARWLASPQRGARETAGARASRRARRVTVSWTRSDRARAHPAADRARRLRRLSEQARPRRARSGPERPDAQRRSARAGRPPHRRRRRRLPPGRRDLPSCRRWTSSRRWWTTPRPSGPSPPPTRSPTSTPWAAGPLTALSIAAFPEKDFPPEWAARHRARRAREAARGGLRAPGRPHRARPEIKFGYAVTGLVDPARMLTNAGGRPGDVWC